MELIRVEEPAKEVAYHYTANESIRFELVEYYILALLLITSGPGEITLSLSSLKWLSLYRDLVKPALAFRCTCVNPGI